MKILIFSLVFLSVLVVSYQVRFNCSSSKKCYNHGSCLKNKCKCKNKYFGERCEYYHPCYKKCPVGEKCVVKNKVARCEQLPCDTNADIIVVLDCSGSISNKHFHEMINTVNNFVDLMDISPSKVHMGAIAFNDHVSPRIIKLNSAMSAKSFKKQLNKYKGEHTGGGTRTDRALNFLYNTMFTKTYGDRDKSPNIAIVLTDGRSNKPLLTIPAAKLLKKKAHVIAIGIGNKISMKELNIIASDKNSVIEAEFDKLKDIIKPLINITCNETDICIPNPCKNGGTCQHHADGYICHCPCGFIGHNCTINCTIKADIMIVVDESGSITQAHFDNIIDAVIQLITTLDVANGKVRIGLLTYALGVFAHFDLNTMLTKQQMLFVANMLRGHYKGGPTFTHKALRYLRQFSFTFARGDRVNYPNYVVLFTDGKSHYPLMTKLHATALHKMGVCIFAIGVGNHVNYKELYRIASEPKYSHLLITTFSNLKYAMMRVIMKICDDLKPLPPCMRCRHKCRCLPGMKCCKGCCRDMVCIYICPKCPKRLRCGSSFHCHYPRPICYKGCCRNRRYIDYEREYCHKCKKNTRCPRGLKCCRGCCRRPIVIEAACMGKRTCYYYPFYKKCRQGMKCCKRCYYGDYNNVYGYGYYYNYYYGYYDYHQANGLPDMRYMSIP